MNSDQYYHLLGLKKDASVQEIRAAYRRLALECHPDKNASARDGVKFKLITEAYQALRISKMNAGRNSDTINENQANKVYAYQKTQSWDFYLNLFHEVIDSTQKIGSIKTIYRYLPQSRPLILVSYGLVRKHIVMPLYGLMRLSHDSINSVISCTSYNRLVKGLLRYLGLYS